MKKALLKKLEAEILALKSKLKELEPYIKENASLAIVYNRTMVEKAILVDEYKKLLEAEGLNKIKKMFKRKPKEKRICDFFFGASC
ncbi:hypothetical protein IKA92_05910 [bacterium]|nr:hypothetical protein [bacterium]